MTDLRLVFMGSPEFSLPVLEADGLPLGLQVMGYANEDAATMSAARAVLDLYSPLIERG